MASDPLLLALAASEMATAAVVGALLKTMISKGLLTSDEGKEVYEHALLMVEESRGSAPHIHSVVDAARALIEGSLRSQSGRGQVAR